MQRCVPSGRRAFAAISKVGAVPGRRGIRPKGFSLRRSLTDMGVEALSVTLLPLTLITGIFGMNVDFPGFGSAEAFWIIVAFMVASALGLVAFFRFKRWL